MASAVHFGPDIVSAIVPLVPDIAPVIVSVMVRLEVLALPWAPAASVVAVATAPLAVPAPTAVRG